MSTPPAAPAAHQSWCVLCHISSQNESDRLFGRSHVHTHTRYRRSNTHICTQGGTNTVSICHQFLSGKTGTQTAYISPLDNSLGPKVNPHLGLTSYNKGHAVSLHKQRHFDITSDPCAKQPFINCRIPNRFGCIITRWNWETVWECASPPLPFFPGSSTRENWASFPTWCQASPFQRGWRFISFTAFLPHTKWFFFPCERATGDINDHLRSVSGSSSDIAQTIELDVTADVTFAAAELQRCQLHCKI